MNIPEAAARNSVITALISKLLAEKESIPRGNDLGDEQVYCTSCQGHDYQYDDNPFIRAKHTE